MADIEIARDAGGCKCDAKMQQFFIDSELAKDVEAARKFRGSLYYQLLNLLPPPSALYNLFPGPNALDKLLPGPDALNVFDGLREKILVRKLVPHYVRAVEEKDAATIKEIEDVFHYHTSLEDALMGGVASVVSVADPLGALYSYVTGKNTLGGASFTNRNYNGERLFTPKSSSTYMGRAAGAVAGVLAWVAFPVPMTITSGAALGIDALLVRYQRRQNQHLKGGN